MKLNIQKLVRVITPIITVLAVVLCSVCPVSAAYVDYIDYVVDVFTHDGVEMCTVKIPAADLGPGVWYAFWGNGSSYSQQGHTLSYTFSPDTTYRIAYRPTQSGNLLLAYDIPDGTHMSIQAKYDIVFGDEAVGYSTPQMQWYVDYMNASGSRLKLAYSEWVDGGFENSSYNIFTIEKPEGTYSFGFGCDYRNFASLEGNCELTITVEYINLTMTISSLYLQFIQNGRNNQILDAVEKALAEQGKTLKDILNGSADMNGSADQFQDDMKDAIEDIENAGDAMQAVTTPSINVEQILPDDVLEGQEFLAYTGAIKKFWDSPVLTSMFAILGGLMFVSFVLFGKRG